MYPKAPQDLFNMVLNRSMFAAVIRYNITTYFYLLYGKNNFSYLRKMRAYADVNFSPGRIRVTHIN